MKRKIMLMLMGILIVGVISVISASTLAAEKPEYGGILKILMSKQATAPFYPPQVGGADRNYTPPFFNRLLYVGEGGGYVPELATSWEASADGKTITFKLRKGVKFHDGTDCDAQAVKSNLDHLIAKKILPGVSSVDVADSHTIRINCPKYDNLVLYNLATGYPCFMYSPTALKKNGEKWAKTHPVGTGPYKMAAEYQRGGIMKLTKNLDYWDKGLPYLDGIEIEAVASEISKMAAMKAGKADIIYDSPPATIAELRDAGYTTRVIGGSIMYMAFDIKNNKILANRKVREAIEYAINKEKLTKGPGLGIYKPAYQAAAEYQYAWNKACPKRMYNPEKAKQLLAEAGYPNGFTFKFLYTNRAWPTGYIGIQNDLAKVGIKMDGETINNAVYVQIRMKGQVEKGVGHQMTTALYGDPLFIFDYFWRSNANEFRLVQKPSQIDDLVEKARAARDESTKVKIAQDIVKLIYDDVTAVPVWITARAAILGKSVRGDQYFVNNDPLNNRYDKLWLKK